MSYICNVCNSSFKRPSGLERHKKTAKYCLLLHNTSVDTRSATQSDNQISTLTDTQSDNQTGTLIDNQIDNQTSTPTSTQIDNQTSTLTDSQISTQVDTQINKTYSRLPLDKKTDKIFDTLHKFGLHPYEQYLHSVKRMKISYLFVLYSSGLLDENGHLTLTISKQFNF